MAVAAAILGGSAIAGAAGVAGGAMANSASRDAVERATQAQAEATRAQVDEARRARNQAVGLVMPQIEQQRRAAGQFENTLGFGAGRDESGAFIDKNLNQRRMAGESAMDTELGRAAYMDTLTSRDSARDEGVMRADRERLYRGIDSDTGVQQARDRRLAGDTLEGDIGYSSVADRQLAAASMAEDERFRFAQDTAVVGDTFEQSPGFQFMMEQAMNEVDRRNSRGGGNFGGRAMMEAMRRAEGEAQKDYYNWVGARHRDLGRQDAAASAYQGQQAFDASRLDAATLDYLRRQGVDIGREDAAVADARRREELDVGRGDQALRDFYQRRMYDQARQDRAIGENQRLREYDQARQDTGYYNYLGALAGMGGFNQNPLGMAVGATQQAGAQAGAAYANQGNILAGIHQAHGQQRAASYGAMAGSVNNATQGGIGNALLYKYVQGA